MNKKKKIYEFIVNILMSPAWLISKLTRSPHRYFLNAISKKISKDKYDIFYREIPKDFSMNYKHNIFSGNDKIAIVMQGPIKLEEHFTLKTAKYYIDNYPDAYVIVSTWDTEDETEISSLKSLGAIVVLNSQPKNKGNLNVNLQLISSYGGIKKGVDLGAVFIAKTRTDQLIKKTGIFYFFAGQIEHFKTECKNQKGRIITLSINYGNVFFPYFMSDFLYFGYADDLIKLFSQKLDERELISLSEGATRFECSSLMYPPEIYILRNYLLDIGLSCEITVKDYWSAVKKALISFDYKFVDLIWTKYDSLRNLSSFYGDYFEDDTILKVKTQNFDFVTWYLLYNGTIDYNEKYEEYLNVPFKK